MPNWNSNYMDIKSKGNNVKNVLRFIKENFSTEKVQNEPEEYIYILDFEKYLPTPLDEKGEIINDWYEWRLMNWGCKWSPCSEQHIFLNVKVKDCDLEIFENGVYGKPQDGYEFNEDLIDKLLERNDVEEIELNVTFETPWGPPFAIIKHWFEDYKNEKQIDVLKNKYYEPGCCFAGIVGFDGTENMWIDNYYEGWIDEEYTKFLIEEDLESFDYYVEMVMDLIEEMHEKDGKEFITNMQNKVNEALINPEVPLELKVKLITQIQEKYNEK